MFSVMPPSGISQTITLQSSPHDAITWSLYGQNCRSRTAAVWPQTLGAFRSTRPVCARKRDSCVERIVRARVRARLR